MNTWPEFEPFVWLKKTFGFHFRYYFGDKFNANLFKNRQIRNSKFNPKTSLNKSNHGYVIFVGGGSGDVELLTLKAIKAFEQADVVLVDWLVNPEINQYIPQNVERIFVGKKCGHHSMKQSAISSLILRYALQGKTVVRLKGGDPSIFARLAEETELLATYQIPFQIVPGITAASGCAAYSGIPLTLRDCASSVRFVTAHLQNEPEHNRQGACNWQHLAQDDGTLVFYMGLNRISMIADKLMAHGMAACTPIAVVDQGTSANQSICCSTLNAISSEEKINTFTGPALIIVGEVVSHRVAVDLSLVTQTPANTGVIYR
ncbi:uroporphyrinogen-III C-methyltransferase [Colwellia sp. MEBiC06753]